MKPKKSRNFTDKFIHERPQAYLAFGLTLKSHPCPVSLGPLEGGEGALLREEPPELVCVQRRLLLRQLRRDPLPRLGRRPPPDGVQGPRAVLGARQSGKLALQGWVNYRVIMI